MSRPESKTLFLVAGLFVVLGVLAALQYRWAGELSTAEKERMRRTAAESARRLSGDFDAAILAIGQQFRREPSPFEEPSRKVADSVARLDSRESRLVKDVWIVRLDAWPPESLRLDRNTFVWSPQEPPDYIQRLENRALSGRPPRFEPVIPEGPALVLPINEPPVPSGAPGPKTPAAGPTTLVVIDLDRDVIMSELMPELVRRYFGDDESRAWSVSLIDDRSQSILYSTDPFPAAAAPADFEASVLGAAAVADGQPPQRPGGPPDPTPSRRPPGEFRRPPDNARGAAVAGPWRIEIRHRDGTLDEAVSRSRMRNLALGGAVLALLLTGGLIIIANAHRSRELARQQLEFVAAVTHELNTPIAGICSAGQNLADGVVHDADQVRRYGDVILREGRRLSTMVEHVLEFAGMQRRSRPIEKSPHTIGEIVEHALSMTTWMAEENGVRLERDIRDEGCRISCDRDALARALANLVSNAIKYRGSSDRITVSAREDAASREAVFAVKDRGIGLTRTDRRRIFDPFVRGSNARDRAIRGSGLGLSIVEKIVDDHGGRVLVDSSPGRGSTFSIRVPTS